jgi:uncharacterized protein (DUF305 family)
MRAFATRLEILALIGLGVAGCGGTRAPEPPSAAELEALYRTRTESARGRFTEADVQFVTGMIHHHAQALVMAGWAPTHGASASIRTLAARIINAQQDEIGLMQRWLGDRGQPVPEVMIMNGEVMVHGAEHAAHMPGMLTPEQLTELERANGPEFDRIFLSRMIQHHRGAVTMVEQLLAHEGAAQDRAVFKLAADVNVDQTTEIARMQRMLAELP